MQEEKGTTEDEMAGWHHWLNERESEWTPRDGIGQGALGCCNSWDRKESDMTEWMNWSPVQVEAHGQPLWECKNLSKDSNFFWGCREQSTLWTKKFASHFSKQMMLQASSHKPLHLSINVKPGGTLVEIRLCTIKSLVTALTLVWPEELTWDRKKRY